MRGFKVKVAGEYIARATQVGVGKQIRTYEIEVNIPSMDCALSVIKNKMLTPILSKKYHDYSSYRTYHIVEVAPLDEASAAALKKVNVRYMGRENLLRRIDEENLPVDPDLYPDLFKLREAVIHAGTDPEGYLKKLALRRGDLELEVQLAQLNPELLDGSPAISSNSKSESGTVTSDRPAGEPRKAAPRKAAHVTEEDLARSTESRLGGLTQQMMADGDMTAQDAQKGAGAQEFDV